MEKNYKTILEEKLGDLKEETKRQTEERKESDNLTDKVLQYSYKHGLLEKGLKVGGVTVAAYVAGAFIPVVGGILGPATLLLYGGKKLIYDPFFKKKKK
ncbi:MAG: hypothetical protein Q8N77_03245 [Nanoarchaeota archaeon]|nr:hypothetical protein [Nanoarchaeota archaeon]